jgi:hypothetical protein
MKFGSAIYIYKMDVLDGNIFKQDRTMTTIITAVLRIPQGIIRYTRALENILYGLGIIKRGLHKIKSTFRKHNQQKYDDLLGTNQKLPDLLTTRIAGHIIPLPVPHPDTVDDFLLERRTLVAPHVLAGMQHVVDGTTIPTVAMPRTKDCLSYLLLCLQNSPAHWYVTTDTDKGGRTGTWWSLDATPAIGLIERAPMGCVYNVHKVGIADDCSRVAFTTTDGSIVEWSDGDDMEKIEMYSFFTLVMLQQLNEACYHNWVHFYFNDVVIYGIKSTFPEGHWVRILLDAHMRYQEVLNQAGLFSNGPNNTVSHTGLDDIVYPGMLSNWPLSLFQENIADTCLGYYKGATHSEQACSGRRLGFNLVDILYNRHTKTKLPGTPMRAAIDSLQKATQEFVRTIVQQHASNAEDLCRMTMFNRSVLQYLDPESVGTTNDVRELFVLLVSRYILNVAHVHGIEHYMMNLSFAPLRLPQRIREVFMPGRPMNDYFQRVDAINSLYGHRIYTRYRPASTQSHDNWSSIRYTFLDTVSQTAALQYIDTVHGVHATIRNTVIRPFQTLWDIGNIDWSYDQEYLHFDARYIGLSICM